jgi:hypothetical protein
MPTGLVTMPKNILIDSLHIITICIAAVIPLAFIAIFFYGLIALVAPQACAMEKLGTISRNPFVGDSTSNPFSPWNNPFNPNSPRNPYGPYGNPFSPYSPNNPFATQTPGIYGYADEAYSAEDEQYGQVDQESGYQENYE